LSSLHDLTAALDAIPLRAHEPVSAPALKQALGELPDALAGRLQQVSRETLNLVSALAATYRGADAPQALSVQFPHFPTEHKAGITALAQSVLAEPGDLEAKVVAILETMRAQLTGDLDQLRRYERVQQFLANLVVKKSDATRDLFEGVR
jgi:hypothetical protein